MEKRAQRIDSGFRVLIIGKTGCGKTTILEKICGDEIADAPSEKRGLHNIEKELISVENNLFVAHDSMGFEAGTEKEMNIVLDFIKRRSEAKDPADRIHSIWYCMQSGPRPVQKAETVFFNSRHGSVPVIAILTKFDLLMEEMQQKVEDDGELEDDEAEEEAEKQATAIYEEHFKKALMSMKYPPTQVIKLSNGNCSLNRI
ncbi:hypothetical protein SISNIDRAFT_407322 [Sistotremastrum niveocremeum HHB9708]|uniref:G domain-containing protein n=1 Tax=Sistotremastrum niveocremeum HHB9708 TaxID=1314777 RepID=A0A164XS94_9AGAM|nr:hypothetical protein SISNIDRAFT_407322 [Sistotremastrum niveocremeum HHB9708]